MEINDLNEVEKNMTSADMASRDGAKAYIDRNSSLTDDDLTDMRKKKERSSVKEYGRAFEKNVVNRIADKIRAAFQRKEVADESDEDISSEVEADPSRITRTEEEEHIKGFDKRHIISAVMLLGIIICFGVSCGLTMKDDKAKKSSNEIKTSQAVTGNHLDNIPRDYSELAAERKRLEAESKRKAKMEAGANGKFAKEDKSTSEKLLKGPEKPVEGVPKPQLPVSKQDLSHEKVNAPVDPAVLEKMRIKAQMEELRKQAMSSSIRFDIGK